MLSALLLALLQNCVPDYVASVTSVLWSYCVFYCNVVSYLPLVNFSLIINF